MFPGEIVDDERCMWKVQICLDLLAQLTNSCGPCQKRALCKHVDLGIEGHPIPLSVFVAHQLVLLRPFFRDLDLSDGRNLGSMQGILAFLMNLAHDSCECAELLGEHGVIDACAELTAVCCGDLVGAYFAKGSGASYLDETRHFQERVSIASPALECALGLMINVCRNSKENQNKLVAFTMPGTGHHRNNWTGCFMQLLSKLLLTLNTEASVQPSDLFSDNCTRSNKGTGELVSMCVAILLGYLIETNMALQNEVAKFLWPIGLKLVADQIEMMVICCSSHSSPVSSCDTSALKRIVGQLVSAKL